MTDALIPTEHYEVDFYGEEIVAVRLEDGRAFVPVRWICDAIGLDWSAQRQRIMRDDVLAGEVQRVVVITTRRGEQESLALPLKFLPGWLFGVSAGRVKKEIKDRLITFRRECFDVLNEAMQEGRLSLGNDDVEFEQALAAADPATVSAYHQAQAVVRLARNQILIQAQMADHGRRLDAIEATLGAGDHAVTQDQASQISQAVKAVAVVLTKQSGSNQFGSVYGELYRKFSITSHKLLPAARFQEAMDWLTDWHQTLVGDEPF